MRHATWTGPFLLLGLLAPHPGRAVPPPPAAPDLPVAPGPSGTLALPAGIADPAGRTGFLAGAGGGVDAVDLTTGDVLWQTTEAQRPLLVVGDRLYAQAGVRRNRLRVLA